MFGTRIVKEYNVFKPLIKWLRNKFDDHGILIEIEKTAHEWKERLDIEKKRLEELRKQSGANVNEYL